MVSSNSNRFLSMPITDRMIIVTTMALKKDRSAGVRAVLCMGIRVTVGLGLVMSECRRFVPLNISLYY